MGRHRDTRAATRPIAATTPGGARSHRRPPGAARARAVSLVAVGALAGGIAIASTSAPWLREASLPRPDAGPGDDASPAPGSGPPVLPAPAGPSASPASRPAADVPASEVWHADGPGAFGRTPWNTVGASPPRVSGDEVAVDLTGRGQRSELEPAVPVVGEGSRQDVTFSLRLDGTFAPGPSARQVVARWENDGPGRAPLDLRLEDGELVLHGGEGHPSGPRTFTRSLGPAPIAGWIALRLAVRFSSDPTKASVSVWRDGRPLVVDDHPRGGTLYPGQQSYLKVGLHRDPTVALPSTVRFRALGIDHTAGEAPASAHRATTTPAGTSDRATSPSSSETPSRDEADRDVARSSSPSTAAARRPQREERGSTRSRTTPSPESSRDRGSRNDSDRQSGHLTSSRAETSPESRSQHREPETTRPRRSSSSVPPSAREDASPRRTAQDPDSPGDVAHDRASAHTDDGRHDDSAERDGGG
ncbi:heparin lyase I family protein [Actinomycetospora aeridis]|uniref:Heparin lyase I family protein n=1 Tax=Actinomycetospora aeridis TaxID=3129231 RepID=A0ABU8N5P5_9PSEU